MKSRATTWILTIALMITFVPMISFGAVTDDNTGDEQIQEPAVIACDADIDPSLRQVPKTRGTSSTVELRKAAHTKLREIIDSCADIDRYRSNTYNLTEEQTNELTAIAEEKTANCTTDYEKIQAIYELVADSLYYDYDFYVYHTKPTTDYGYNAWNSTITVCQGYADMCKLFLNSLDIPCMLLVGEDHAYNAAFDSQDKRWIFFDSTWGSWNTYKNGVKTYGGHTNSYYDMSIDRISQLNNHECYYRSKVFLAPEDGASMCYRLSTPSTVDEWVDLSLWELTVDSSMDNDLKTIDMGFSEIKGIPITTIGDWAFSKCKDVSSIILPDSLTTIGEYAFAYCKYLTNISLPNSVTRIGLGAFYGCSGLTGVTLSDNIICIENYAFYGCKGLTSVTLPDNLITMGIGLFYECRYLTDVTFPSGITKIENQTFKGCTRLTSITVPDGVTSIGNDAFSDCSSLTSITMLDNLTSIGDNAFKNCSNLTSITIPQNLTHIGKNAFYECSSLTGNITIPGNLTNIEDETFYNCRSLTGITIQEGVTGIGKNAFRGCNSLTSITIPGSLTSIGECAFGWCSRLKSITLPDSLTSIGQDAFRAISSLKIYCNKNSYAHLYAVDNGISYKLWTSLSDCEISLDQEAYETTGEPIKPAVTVKDGDTILKEGDQYSVSESDVVLGDATATVTGLDNYFGEVEVSFKINDHQWNDFYTVDKEGTCLTEGIESIHCSVCGAIKEGSERPIQKGNHKYGEWYTVTAATCTKDGVREKTCSICGDTVSETIQAEGHSFADDFTVDLKPSCTREGSKSRHCKNCTEVTEVTPIVPTGHTFGQWNIITPNNCLDSGLRQHTCEICGLTESENLNPTGHNLEEVYTVDVAATCTTDGSQSKHCKNCDAVFDSQTITALGHDMVHYDAKAATCTENGYAEYNKCARCGTEEGYVEILASGHQWTHIKAAAGLLKNGSEYDQCSLCKKKKNVKTLTGYAASYVRSFKVAPAKGAFTAKWKKQSKKNLKKFKGYQIRYSTKANMKGAKYVNAGKKATSKKIGKLKKKTKYYVQVRTYTVSKNVKYYSKWSAKKVVKTK